MDNTEKRECDKANNGFPKFKKSTSLLALFFRDLSEQRSQKDRDSQDSSDEEENGDEKKVEDESVIGDFAQKSTISGMKYVSDKKSRIPRRCFWLLVVLTGAGFLVYQIVRSVNLYLDYPVNVDVKITYANDLPFPAITICNMNLLRRLELEHYEGHDAIEFLELLYPLVTEKTSPVPENIIQNFTLTTVANLTDLLMRYGHQKENMVILCHWKSSACSSVNFTTTITDYGLCHTFNSGLEGTAPLRVDNTGARYGLTLYVDIEQGEYGRGPRESAGLKIAIHNQRDIPLVSDLGFAVSPGTHTLIGLRMTKISSLPNPYGLCKSKKLQFYGDYTMSKCQLECLTHFIVGRCGCKQAYMPGQVRHCSPQDVYNCYLPNLGEYAGHKDMCECPVPCERTIYSSRLSYAQFPSDFAANEYSKLLNNSDSDYIRRNGLKLEIFYEELSFKEVTHQVEYELFKLFSDIGGSMGLLLGASFVTIVEIFDFACLNLYRRVRSKWRPRITPIETKS
uniref:Acid-sensing ion channel 3-like n=1 Tax=Saccoglossus kowalevskii TaxID=10224 RepID=A0ABM0M5Y1_SACKO|nr:PREDICTED: acid-sensing ion channel 3-like [Saccoglossus kowalevskii]